MTEFCNSRPSCPMSLAEFILTFALPQRAKVFSCSEYDNDDDVDLHEGDVIQIRRVECPCIHLSFHEPTTGKSVSVSALTTNPTQFQVVCANRIFSGVKDLIKSWPLLVRAHNDWNSSSINGRGTIVDWFRDGDLLRPIRQVVLPDRRMVLECAVVDKMRIVQLPMTYRGEFSEMPTKNGYTLAELVAMAKVPRRLKMMRCTNCYCLSFIDGVPINFDGLLELKEPNVLVEVKTIQGDAVDIGDSGSDGAKFLLPIDCEVLVLPCAETFLWSLSNVNDLSQVCLSSRVRYPFFARIVNWTTQTTILHNQQISPGDTIIVYDVVKSISKIFASCGERRFLIPVDYPGIFTPTFSDGITDQVRLSNLGYARFPFNVRHRYDSRVLDYLLPEDELITFDGFLESEETVVVARQYFSILGDSFRLPLRTRLTIQVKRKSPRSQLPSKTSVRDRFVEELTRSAYDELLLESNRRIAQLLPVTSEYACCF